MMSLPPSLPPCFFLSLPLSPSLPLSHPHCSSPGLQWQVQPNHAVVLLWCSRVSPRGLWPLTGRDGEAAGVKVWRTGCRVRSRLSEEAGKPQILRGECKLKHHKKFWGVKYFIYILAKVWALEPISHQFHCVCIYPEVCLSWSSFNPQSFFQFSLLEHVHFDSTTITYCFVYFRPLTYMHLTLYRLVQGPLVVKFWRTLQWWVLGRVPRGPSLSLTWTSLRRVT